MMCGDTATKLTIYDTVHKGIKTVCVDCNVEIEKMKKAGIEPIFYCETKNEDWKYLDPFSEESEREREKSKQHNGSLY